MKYHSLILTSFLLFSLSTIAFSQNENDIQTHPIDQRFNDCIGSAENQSTAGMIQYASDAHDVWDKEMNNYYKLLMNILSDDEKNKLNTSQKHLLEYRDGEFLFSGAAYNSLSGTMWLVATADRERQLVRQRAVELKTYYEIISDNK